MAQFVLRRLLWAVPVLVGAVTLSFIMIRLIPGNPVQDMLAGQPSQPALERALTNQFHLNKPVIEQYGLYMASVVRGNFGLSLTTGSSVVATIGSVVGSTLELTGLATLIGLILGFVGGIATSWISNKSLDRGAAAAQMVAVSMPTFWLGLLLLTLFSFNLHLFPATGNSGFKSLVLPSLAMGLPVGAVVSQLLRSGMLEVLREPFITTARAKGLGEWRVRLGHAFRNAVLPTLNYIGVIFGALITGAVVVEAVFSRQGLGRMVVTAVTNKDYPLVQGIVILIALAYVLINIAVDLIHAALDPADPGMTTTTGYTREVVGSGPRPDGPPVIPGVVADTGEDGSSGTEGAGGRSRLVRLGWFVLDEPVVVIAILFLVVVLVCALFPGLVAGRNPDTSNLLAARKGPSAAHWFGTDQIGRDVFSRVIYGTRISLLIGIGATLVGALLGCILGVVAGFVGGITDSIVMRCIDVLLAFPGVLLALGVIAIYGPGIETLLVAIGVISIPGYARVIRAEVVSAKTRPFVEAAVSTGARRRRLVFRHVLPNALPPIIVLATVGVGFSLLAASSLSFLGLGPQPPSPEWGAILADGRSFLETAWWIAVFPGLAILLTVAAVNVLGQWLRERFDVRSRQ